MLVVIGSYLNAYSVTILSLVVVYFFVQQRVKNECINWLYVCNSIVPWITLVYMLIYAAGLFISWYGQNPYEWYAFTQNRARVWSPYGWSYWLMLSLNFLFPQLLWFKKLRKSIGFTVIMIIALSFGFWFERLVIYITSAYPDYLPSSWSVYNGRFFLQWLWNTGCFIIVSLSVYWVFHKRKKLPFPSAILSNSLFFISYFLL